MATLPKLSADALADKIEKSDHMVLMNCAPDPEDDMVGETVCADDHNLIVDALRAYALSWRRRA